jgi:hypothetical protein
MHRKAYAKAPFKNIARLTTKAISPEKPLFS